MQPTHRFYVPGSPSVIISVMPEITSVYKEYKIPKNLQEHQLRVAAVASQICDGLTTPVHRTSVIKACLLHDMGNIIKFDMRVFPEAWEPEGAAYWQAVKDEYIEKYGPDEHHASIVIARELGLNALELACIKSIDFGKTVETLGLDIIEPKICDNADLRVDPHGVVSLAQRLEEGHKRHKGRPDKWLADDVREKIVQACRDMEAQIFAKSKIKPEDITSETTAPIIEELRTYVI